MSSHQSEYKVRVSTEADATELERYQAKLQEIQQFERGTNAREGMAADQAAFEEKRNALLAKRLELERYIAATTAKAADPVNNRAGMAADQSAWEEKRNALLRNRAAAAAEVARAEKVANEIGQHNIGFLQQSEQATKNATAATDKFSVSKKGLISNLKILSHEIPGLSTAITLLKNPITAAGLAIGVVIHQIVGYINKVNEAAAESRGFENFLATMESLSDRMRALNEDNRSFAQGMKAVGAAAETAAQKHQRLADTIKDVARLEAELADKQLALENQLIDERTDIGGAEKTRLKLEARQRADERRLAAEQDQQTRSIFTLTVGSRESAREAARKRAEAEGLTAEQARRMEARDKAAEQAAAAEKAFAEKAPGLQKRIGSIQDWIAGGGTPGSLRQMPDLYMFFKEMGIHDVPSAQRHLGDLQSQLGDLTTNRRNARGILLGKESDVKETEAERTRLRAEASAAAAAARQQQEAADKATRDANMARPYREAGANIQQQIDASQIRIQQANEAEKARAEQEKRIERANQLEKQMPGKMERFLQTGEGEQEIEAMQNEIDALRRGLTQASADYHSAVVAALTEMTMQLNAQAGEIAGVRENVTTRV